MRGRSTSRWLLCAALSLAPRAGFSFPLRVVAASELRVEPRLAPDRSSLALRITLQDDRGAPLARREVSVSMWVDGQALAPVAVQLSEVGEAEVVRPLARAHRVVDVAVAYAGDEGTAPRALPPLRVVLDAPYVTLDVAPPPAGVELGAAPAELVVTMQVGDVVDFPRHGHAVEVREVGRTLATGTTDVTGRATLRVPTTALREPRVYTVRAVTSVQGELVEGPPRPMLVRARTALSLVRAEGAGDAVVLRGALVTTTGLPVRDASVRIARGSETLAGARTDARGGFEVRVGEAILAEHGVSVRAHFEPPEPWYTASESPALELTGPAPARIHWAWVVTPAVLAAAAALAVAARARLRGEGRAKAPEGPATAAAWDRVEHVASAHVSGLRVRFVVVDRATSQPVEGAMVRWGGDPTWQPVTGESVAVQPARRVEFELGASGYAPRRVSGEFSRPGEYVLRAQLRTWREELFERARPWLRRVGRDGALPTLREALATRAATPAARAFVEHVEEGCYAPRAPDASHVARAEELSAIVADDVPSLGRD